MQLVRVVWALCLLLTILTEATLAAPTLRGRGRMSLTAPVDPLNDMLQEHVVSDLLSRNKRSYAQLSIGRQHYFGGRSRATRRRRYPRRYNRRHHRLHYQGRGQIVDQ